MNASAPISLYFDVPKGERADLEAIARATIEWISIIRDIASVVAPNIEFDIEFVESEDGSVWLSSLLQAVKEGDRKALATIATSVVAFFALGPALHLQTDLGDAFWERLGHTHKVDLSEQDKNEIVTRVKQAINETPIEQHRQRLVQQAERDEDIRGVGVSLAPVPSGPVAKIPRELFPAYGAIVQTERPPFKKDTTIHQGVRVKVIRANLEEGEPKPRWRFAEGETRWSADIEDSEFVLALNLDRTGLHLAVGQTMIVDVAIDLRFVDGAWEENNRRVIRVIEPRINRRQGSFDLGAE